MLKGTSDTGTTVSETAKDNGDGTYTFAEVAFGEYKVSETAAPTGYEIGMADTDVTVDADNVESELAYEVEDPEKTGTIQITKTDATTKAALEGAEFTLTGTNSAGKEVEETATTGTDGVAKFTEVAFGEYKLAETKAPKGYEITFEETDVTIDAKNVEKTYTVDATDKEKTGTIQITKTDATTKAALEGAEFTLTGKNSAGEAVEETVTTDENGVAEFKKVAFGKYKLTESKAPEGYEITFEETDVTIDAKNVEKTYTVDATDKEKTGTIQITKTDATTKEKLAGAEFKLTGTTVAGKEVEETAKSGDDGIAEFTEVAFGEYKLAETKAPKGYEITFEETDVTIDAKNVEKTYKVDATDKEKKGSIKITKTDATTGAKLEGAEFTLTGTNSAGEKVEETATTGADGVAKFTEVAFGEYKLAETKAPKGYEISYKGADIVIDANNVEEEISVPVTDGQETGTIKITKTDATTGEKLAGAVFTLTGTTEGKVEVNTTAKTDDKGVAEFTEVAFGTYVLSETTAPKGYDITFKDADVVINAKNVGETYTVDATDKEKTGTVQVTKTDAVTGVKLAGAEFMLKGKNSAGEDVEVKKTTGTDGIAVFDKVAFGTYELTETKAPKGYEITYKGEEVTVDASNVDTTKEIVVADGQETGTIEITKTDATTKDKLTGATFTLTGTTEGGEDVSKTAKDNGDGTYTFESVAFGTYDIAETKAPKGYEITFEGKEVTVDASNVTETIKVAATDKEKTGKVVVTKSDKTVATRTLAGAEFMLKGTDSAGKAVELTATTNENGVAEFDDVAFGTYKLTETKAPKGYEISYKGEDVTINADNVEADLEYAVTDDQKTGTIVITKTDATTEDVLTGAVFTLTGTTEGGVDVNKPSTDNGDGTYTFAEVPFGTYTVTETTAPTGYEVSFEGEDVTVNAKNVESELTYTVEDPEKTGTVEVTKTDATTGALLAGAEFTLTGTNSEGKKVEVTETTGTNGVAKFTDVAFGEYTLTETKAPKGYSISYKGQKITIDASNVAVTQEVAVTDPEKTGTIKVTKSDAATKELLAGAEFTLTGTDSAGKTVEVTKTTDKDGVAEFTEVAFGEYTLSETKAPVGWDKAFEDKSITIDAKNVEETYTVDAKDNRLKVEVPVSKTWTDADDQDGVRPTEITFNLLADGKKQESKTVTKADNWSWTFTDLNEYVDGKKVVYTVTEDEVKEYTTEITSSAMTDAKVYKIEPNTTVTKKVSSLSANKKYYVQIRTYKTVDDVRYFSGWSKVKTVTTK